MIFQGRKVLDGSVDSIQEQYARNQLTLRLAGGAEPPALDGIETVSAGSREYSLQLAAAQSPQAVLQQLVSRGCEVEHFEVKRPSLHDIFVSIARPTENKEGSES